MSNRTPLVAAALAALLCLAGCDQKRVEKLEEGLATEADVRRQFGEPQVTYAEPGGAQTFEYSRQPEGQVAYMVTIGSDGRMSALRQVLKPSEFAKVLPGMTQAQVRRLLGRPAKTTTYDLKPDEEQWEWRWRDLETSKVFTVTFDRRRGAVTSTAITDDTRETHTPG